ncbi:MAG: thiolase family protein [Salinisphaera sp.]|nr:thiolase family protein [Salinisphaera sp.]
MKFSQAYIPLGFCWSSPFVRWQGRLADISSLDLGVAVTNDALAQREFDPGRLTQLVMGTTVPQQDSFYAAPWTAARIGAQGITGAHISQACATAVACLAHAAAAVDNDPEETILALTTDRTSNGPLMVYPKTRGMGGAPGTEHWVLDNFAADPNTGQAMVATAESVAAEGGFTRGALDEVSLLRYQQYEQSLIYDRAFQRRYMQPIRLQGRKGKVTEIEADEGVQATTAEGLAALKPMAGGVVTLGMQTHPADGCAGTILCNEGEARTLSGGEGVVRIIATGFGRAPTAQMPKAPVLAADRALANAGLDYADMKLINSHNPFAVNDLWFESQTGYPLDKTNTYGSSLIYGHPQGPTGLRSIAELIESLRLEGGGYGLFTGCAAGDTGAAVVLEVLG